MSDSTFDPDIREVFAELHRQDEEREHALGFPPSPKLPPIRPIEMLKEDESAEEYQARVAESKRRHKEPNREEVARMMEDNLARMKKALDVPSGSDAVDAASRRVYASSVALHEFSKARGKPATGAPPDFSRTLRIMHESHAAFEALWVARLEQLRTTCAPEMRPKVEKALSWQLAQIDNARKLQEEGERAMTELERLRGKS